ncbi:MAG: GMC family oxidoreductase [Lautropia sp.]
MLIDGRTVARDSCIECDLCIIGAGPAGLAAAQEFFGQDLRVCLVESGDFEPDPATQALADCEVTENDDLYPNPIYAHDRRIGGTASQWDVMLDSGPHLHLTPLDPADLRARSWVAHSGWPVEYSTLRTYYARAQSLCGAGGFDYDPASWSDESTGPFSFDSGRVVSKMLATGPQAQFLKALPRRVAASRNIRLLTWSNAVELVTNADANNVRLVRIACLGGNRYRIAARFLILAQGAFEVPRLLLASRAAAPAGLGNGRDLVGRFLMDRQIVKAGRLVPATRGGFNRFAFYDLRQVHGRHVMGKLALSQQTLAREGILQSLISFSPQDRSLWHRLAERPFGRGTTFRAPAYRSARALLAAARDRHRPTRLLRHLARVVGGLDDLMYIKLRGAGYRREFNLDNGGWTRLPESDRRFHALDVHQMCEQSPDRENRLTLSRSHDATGMPLLKVHLRWHELDIQSALRTQEIMREEFRRSGVGELRIERRGNYPLLAQMSAHHPSGTTRMSLDPSSGVMDGDCKVHGVGNLFVASSAVFPTSGNAPPTLTIIALTLRVCDRIKDLLEPATVELGEMTG